MKFYNHFKKFGTFNTHSYTQNIFSMHNRTQIAKPTLSKFAAISKNLLLDITR